MFIAKYDATGSLVTTFGSNGAVAVDFGGGNNTAPQPGSNNNLLIQHDGKLVIAAMAGFASGTNAGYNFALARLWP
jgi:hypothetical protein